MIYNQTSNESAPVCNDVQLSNQLMQMALNPWLRLRVLVHTVLTHAEMVQGDPNTQILRIFFLPSFKKTQSYSTFFLKYFIFFAYIWLLFSGSLLKSANSQKSVCCYSGASLRTANVH